jgi:hypothetical protein
VIVDAMTIKKFQIILLLVAALIISVRYIDGNNAGFYTAVGSFLGLIAGAIGFQHRRKHWPFKDRIDE